MRESSIDVGKAFINVEVSLWLRTLLCLHTKPDPLCLSPLMLCLHANLHAKRLSKAAVHRSKQGLKG